MNVEPATLPRLMPRHWRIGSTSPTRWRIRAFRCLAASVIGHSREGRELYGLVAGQGPLRVSITAGAHADEPFGPRTAVFLAQELALGRHRWARSLARSATFHIVPHANPDGDARNAAWQREPVRLADYLLHASREAPPDDIEFHYPADGPWRPPRPENQAIARFLEPRAPFHMHASLHGMGFGEGAWFLSCREWTERLSATRFHADLAAAVRRLGYPLHDWDRGGEKGFTGIAPGFSTTPRAEAMRQHFTALGDHETAAHFSASSMDWVQSLGGDPLCLVSELPVFALPASPVAPRGVPENFLRWRRVLPEARDLAAAGRLDELERLARRAGLAPMPWRHHAWLQLQLVMAGVRAVRATECP
jgi:hypothetical protein